MTTAQDHAREIDEIDQSLVKLLALRFDHSREIGRIKREQGEPPFDPERLRTQTARFARDCVNAGLAAGMAQQLISVIVAQVLVERLQSLGVKSDGRQA